MYIVTPFANYHIPLAPEGSVTLLALDFTPNIVARVSLIRRDIGILGGQVKNFSASSQFIYLTGEYLAGVSHACIS